MSIVRSFTPIIAGLAALVASACQEPAPTPTPVLRLSLAHPAELVVGNGPAYPFGLAVAPDGRRVVFPAARADADSASVQLWLRDLSSGALQALEGTKGSVLPFWSPDGTEIGFFAEGKLRSLRLSDHRVRDLADAPRPAGGAWEDDGAVVFAGRADAGLQRRRADGQIEPFTSLDAGEASHRLPRLFGDSHIVFFVRAHEPIRQGIWIAHRARPNERRRLVGADAEGLTVGDALVYASGDALVAQRIDPERLATTGRPLLIGSPVGRGPEHQLFATGGGDVLLFALPQSVLRELRWMDRTGASLATVGEPMAASDVRLAPDSRSVAVSRVDPQLRTLDIWMYEDRRPVPRRLSPAIDADESPAWSRDGTRVAWVSGRRTVTVRDAAAAQSERVLHKSEHVVRVTDWSADGAWIVLSESRDDTGADVVVLPVDPPAPQAPAVRRYAATPFNETQGVVSPDGRWLAYASDESGQFEIYVDRFPSAGKRSRVTVGGGAEPRWRRDGLSLFFRRGRELHEVELGTGGEAVATTRVLDAGAEIRSFDVAADGKRFLVNVPAPQAESGTMTALVHVRSLLPSAP